MTSTQHEELCRRYIAETFQVPRSSVVRVLTPLSLSVC